MSHRPALPPHLADEEEAKNPPKVFAKV